MNMKKIIPIGLLLGYCVPYVYLAMWGEFDMRTQDYNKLMVAAFALLSFLSKRTGNRWAVIPGNAVSLLMSLFFFKWYRTADWGSHFFKPLGAQGSLLAMSVFAAVIQIVYVYKKKRKRRKAAPPALRNTSMDSRFFEFHDTR